jgi:hypothetical protein
MSETDFARLKKIMQKFIHRIEIGENNIKIKWPIDRLQYETETMLVKTEDGLKAIANFGSHSLESGAPLLQVVEPNGFVIPRIYSVRWYKNKTDLSTLARMRWISGESTKNLARSFEVGEETIKGYLRAIKGHKELKALGFMDADLKTVLMAISRE